MAVPAQKVNSHTYQHKEITGYVVIGHKKTLPTNQQGFFCIGYRNLYFTPPISFSSHFDRKKRITAATPAMITNTIKKSYNVAT